MATKSTSKKSTSTKKATASAKTTSRKTQTTSKTQHAKSQGAKKTSSVASELLESVLKRAKGAGRAAILECLVIAVLGVLLIIRPNDIVRIIFYAVGIFLMIKGAYRILNYFAAKGKYDYYNNDLLYGIIALVFGIIAVILWEQLGQFIGIAVGAWMIYGGLVRMNTAIKMHAAGIKEWFYVLLLAMIMLALGIYMVISIDAIMTVVGWAMLVAAVLGIIDDVIFIRRVDDLAK